MSIHADCGDGKKALCGEPLPSMEVRYLHAQHLLTTIDRNDGQRCGEWANWCLECANKAMEMENAGLPTD